jgi:archaellum component FlaC
MKMRALFKPVSATIVATMFLSACVTTNGASDRQLTPAEQRMREQASTYNQTMMEGALMGCAAGGLVGLLLSNSNNQVENALMGCAAGGVLGGGAGAYVADKQEAYANEEQQLDAMITDVRQENERLAGLVSATQDVIAADKERIGQIDRDLASGKITMEQAKMRMAAVDDNTAYLDNTLAELRKRQQTYAEASSVVDGSRSQNRAMDAELSKLEDQISQLQSERDALVERRTVSRVG